MTGFLPTKVWVLKQRGRIVFVTTSKWKAEALLVDNPTWSMEDYKLNEVYSGIKKIC